MGCCVLLTRTTPVYSTRFPLLSRTNIVSIFLGGEKSKKIFFQLCKLLKYKDLQPLKKCACIYLHWRCILCLDVGDRAEDELRFVITLLKLYTSKHSN